MAVKKKATQKKATKKKMTKKAAPKGMCCMAGPVKFI
jgi:hypothetical protein